MFFLSGLSRALIIICRDWVSSNFKSKDTFVAIFRAMSYDAKINLLHMVFE